jgi:hypothetical protein
MADDKTPPEQLSLFDSPAIDDDEATRADYSPAEDFDGETYIASLDRARLGKQLEAVKTVMADGLWHTPEDLEIATGYRWASISARLRDLRKERFGSWEIERERVPGYHRGNFRYRMITSSEA